MTRHEAICKVADKYRSDGYAVKEAADAGLPPSEVEHLRDGVDLVGEKNGEHVVVEVKRRDELYQIGSLAAGVDQLPSGWSYELVVYPSAGVDDILLEDGEPSADYVESLLAEAQELVDSGRPRAAFLVAWSAVETTMRTAALREQLEIKDGAPAFVLDTLCTYGVIGHEEYHQLRQRWTERNRLVHGLRAPSRPEDVRFMIDLARQLLYAVPADSDACTTVVESEGVSQPRRAKARPGGQFGGVREGELAAFRDWERAAQRESLSRFREEPGQHRLAVCPGTSLARASTTMDRLDSQTPAGLVAPHARGTSQEFSPASNWASLSVAKPRPSVVHKSDYEVQQ